MSIRRDLGVFLFALLAAGLIMSCGMARKDSGGDQTGDGDLSTVAQAVGIHVCYDCHANTAVDGERIFGQWASSVHANMNESPGVRDNCNPCHNPVGDDMNLSRYVGVGSTPYPRGVVSCEGCHGGGSMHYGLGPFPNEDPGTARVCGHCHGLDEEEGDRHSIEGYRYWVNSEGENVGSDNAPSMSTTVVDGVELVVWSLPSEADWVGTYDGPYHFNADRTIFDTHFNAFWILNEDDKGTIYSVPTARLGYVNLANDSPNSGMANADDPGSCLGSCHNPHEFDLTIQLQYARGAHRPVPMGPVDGAPPSEELAFHAVDYGDFSGACDRCHNSVGFAEVAPGFGSYDYPNGDGFITCNACHDGEGYPSASDSRMRFEGEVDLFNNDGTIITTVDAGTSAVCVYCHQGREDPSRVDGTSFRNMHYLASAAVQYAEKGYEYEGKTYNGPMDVHIEEAGNCVGCHMDDVGSEEVGGHTFHVSVDTCAVGGCHGGSVNDFDDFGITADPDGDGNSSESARDEIQGLLDLVLAAIEEADLNPADGTPDVYHQEGYPYFVLNDGQSWSLKTAAAAYNWQFIYKDPGAWAHNPDYTVQLLRDSYEDLTGTALRGR